MDRWTTALRPVVACLGLVLAAAPVCAQAPSAEKPYRSLFGGTDAGRRSLHSLDLRFNLNAGIDDGFAPPASVEPEADAIAETRYDQFYDVGVELGYTRSGRRVEAEASGSADLPYYASFPESNDLAYGARGSVRILGRSTSISALGSYAYSPFYAPALDPGYGSPVVPSGSSDYTSAFNPNQTASGGVSLVRRFSRESSMTLGYVFDGVTFEDDDRSNRNHSARVTFDRKMSRSVNMNAGYGYRDTGYGTGGIDSSSRSHDLDVGVSVSRKTIRRQTGSFNVGIGASAVDFADEWSKGWRGSVGVTQGIGSGWTIGASYRRTLDYYLGIQEPVWADFVDATASGRFGQRVDVSLGALYSSGREVAGRSEGYDIYSASARLQVAVAAFVAITADYVYYRYDFPAGYDLPAGMPSNMNRNRVLVGARFWVPLVRAGRAGEPRDSQGQ